MKLDQRYPDAQAGFATDDGFVKRSVALDCKQCGWPTPWFHARLRLFFCSVDCLDRYRRDNHPGSSGAC